MKFSINQEVFLINSRSGQILINRMVIDRIQLNSGNIYYSGITEDVDSDRETAIEDRLFPSFDAAMQGINSQLIILRGQHDK